MLPDVLSREEVRNSFDCVQTFMKGLTKSGNEHWTQLAESSKGKIRQSQMMQLATGAMIAVKVIQKEIAAGKLSPDEASDALEKQFVLLMQSCKQCIDRGPVMLLLTKIFFDISQGKKADTASTHRMMGLLVGRPMQVDNRLIVSNRFRPFYDVLKVIGAREDIVRDALQPALRD